MRRRADGRGDLNSTVRTMRKLDSERYGDPGPAGFDSGRASALVIEVSKL